MTSAIVGFGDVGRRIACLLKKTDVVAVVRSQKSALACSSLAGKVMTLNLDCSITIPWFNINHLYYLVPPQKQGVEDQRSRDLLYAMSQNDSHRPKRVVLISTTGVYGDCGGEWVTEQSPVNPQTERGQRRLDMERQWLRWGKQYDVPIMILRVPGIYAYDRLPMQRLLSATPVVRPQECGFSNRIHADDLAQVAVAAMQQGHAFEVYNATDGVPGKISDYLQHAAKVLSLPPLPEISMSEAKQVLSVGMLSYLSESRKISNQKMLCDLKVELQYPDFKQGMLV